MAVITVLQNNITENVSMKKIFPTVEYLSVVEHQIWLPVNCKSADLSKEDLSDNKFTYFMTFISAFLCFLLLWFYSLFFGNHSLTSLVLC